MAFRKFALHLVFVGVVASLICQSAMCAATSHLLQIPDRISVVGLDTNRDATLVAVLERPRNFSAQQPYLLRIFRTATKREIFSLPLDADVESQQKVMKLSPDGRFVAVSDGQYVNVWDIATKQNVARIGGKRLTDFSWTPNSKFILALVGYDPVLIAFSPTGTKQISYGSVGQWGRVRISANGATVAVAANARDAANRQLVSVWNIDGQKLSTKTLRGRFLGFSRGGGLASVERVTDATYIYRESDRPANDMRLDASVPSGAIKNFSLAPDGGILAFGDSAGALKMVHLPKRALLGTHFVRQDLEQRSSEISGMLSRHAADKPPEDQQVAAFLSNAMISSLRKDYSPSTADHLTWTPDSKRLLFMDGGRRTGSGTVASVAFE